MVRAVLAGAVGLLLLACGSNPTGVAETAYDFTFTDPAGDTTVATANPDLVRGTDLIGVSGRVDEQEIHLVLEFAQSVSRWSEGGTDALDGIVYFDIDRSTGTGRPDGQPQTVGAEFYLDLRDNGFGKVALVDYLKRKIHVLGATFSGTRFEVTIPRALLETTSDADNRLNLSVLLAGRNRLPLVVDRGADDAAYQLEPPAAP